MNTSSTSPSAAIETPSAALPLTVIGSINQDYFTFVDEFPRDGETVIARSASTGLGGKGCNQAIAAAKLGQHTAFIGAVGADAAGDAALAGLRGFGVAVDGIARTPHTQTGSAFIAVNSAAENTIIVHSGANAAITAGDVDRALESVGTGVLLIQGELPRAAGDAVAAHARATGLPLIVNAAPVDALSAETLGSATVLVVNETEADDLSKASAVADGGSRLEQAVALRTLYGGTVAVVITLGADGVAAVDENGPWQQPAPVPERVLDTTGAGDAFVGVLAASICSGFDLREAVRRAVTAASHSVTSRGIADSYATADELEALLR